MTIKKRQVLWDWTNTNQAGAKEEMDRISFAPNTPVASVVNWNAWVPPELKGRAPFRPMVRGLGNLSGTDWNTVQNTPYPIVLFLNEPERAGISPEKARDIWNGQMLPLRRGKAKKLASPGCASDQNGKNWLDKFWHLVGHDAPDYLCLHWYGEKPEDAQKYLTEQHNKYKKPVMVTEIACTSRDPKQVVRFTARMCNWLDKQQWVFEYGFFDFQRKVADNFVSPAAQLMDGNGNFTRLGQRYLHEQPFNEQQGFADAGLDWHEDLDGHEDLCAKHDDHEEHDHDHDHEEHRDQHREQHLLADPFLHRPEDEQYHLVEDMEGRGEEICEHPLPSHGAPHAEGEHFEIQSFAGGSSDSEQALKIQNDGRRGKGLPALQWDNKLAQDAANWAKHLAQIDKMQHSTSQQRPGQGENLAWAMGSGGVKNPMQGAARMWMNEAKDYHGEPVGQGNFGAYGHYTQCMWRGTTKVGLATAKSAKGGVYTVGRYSPPGNWTGKKPY